MSRISAADRRAALRNRTNKAVEERNKKGLGKKSVLKSIDFEKYQLKAGVNRIDILPFEIKEPWYKDLRSFAGTPIGLDVGYTDYKLEVPVHRNIGEGNDMFLCLKKAFGKKCPICEELYAEWEKEQQDQDKAKIKALSPSWRCFYNVVDYEGDPEKILLWENYSYHLFEKFLQEVIEEGGDAVVTFGDLEEGSTIKFKGREKKYMKSSYIECHSISFENRDKYDDSILDETLSLDSLLNIPTYAEVAKAHLEMDDDGENEKVETPLVKEPTATVKKRSLRKKPTASSELREEASNDSGKCPHGRKFGEECDSESSVCNACDEDTYQECSAYVAPAPEARGRRRRSFDNNDVPF